MYEMLIKHLADISWQASSLDLCWKRVYLLLTRKNIFSFLDCMERVVGSGYTDDPVLAPGEWYTDWCTNLDARVVYPETEVSTTVQQLVTVDVYNQYCMRVSQRASTTITNTHRR